MGYIFYLLVSFSISLINVLYISVYKCFTSLVKLISKCFIILDTIINGVVLFLFQIVYRSATDFYPEILLNLLVMSIF
jgi:hypothetical protein